MTTKRVRGPEYKRFYVVTRRDGREDEYYGLQRVSAATGTSVCVLKRALESGKELHHGSVKSIRRLYPDGKAPKHARAWRIEWRGGGAVVVHNIEKFCRAADIEPTSFRRAAKSGKGIIAHGVASVTRLD